MILGISGSLGSGKDTVAEYLAKKGFQHISLSDLIRMEAKNRGLGLDRDSLRELANVLANEDGPEALAKQAINLKNKKNLAISSVRKPAEVDFLKKRNDFKLIFVDAPIELRYKRIITRGRQDEKLMSIDELREKEKLEMSGQSSQRLDYCNKKADYLIENSGTLENLYAQTDHILEKGNHVKENSKE